MDRRIGLAILAVALSVGMSGCVPLPLTGSRTAQASLGVTHPATADTETIYVASTRARGPDGRFGAGRAAKVSYSSFKVSVPPDHALGTIRFTSGTPDPRVDFATLGEQRFSDGAGFARSVAKGTRSGQAVVFVHGFNTEFDETLYRLAQIDHDFAMPGAKILYAWPTAHRYSLYIHDEDSAAFARDGLETLLKKLAQSGVSRIVLLGHSKGAQIVVETLRQMRIEGNRAVFAKLGGVILLSPDMDVDLFEKDAGRIAPLPQPFVVFGSKDDWPLTNFANFFAAGQPRLGALQDPTVLSRFNLTYIDVSKVADSDRSDAHMPVATSPTLIGLVNRTPNADLGRFGAQVEAGLMPGADVRMIGKMTSIVLPDPPAGTAR